MVVADQPTVLNHLLTIFDLRRRDFASYVSNGNIMTLLRPVNDSKRIAIVDNHNTFSLMSHTHDRSHKS
jgi:hypothetical protein